MTETALGIVYEDYEYIYVTEMAVWDSATMWQQN